MSFIDAGRGVRLYCEESGDGPAVLFLHEFAGDVRSWEPQIRRLSRHFRCIAFNARGYPPSDVPDAPDAYSQDIAVADGFAVLDALGIDRAHLVSHSMGSYTALHMGLRGPERIRSVVVSGCGWGSDPAHTEENVALAREIAEMFANEGIEEAARRYADFPMRHRFRAKDPRGWAEFARWLGEHSATGSALTMANVQAVRPTLFDMRSDLESFRPPLLVIVGDEDTACLKGSLMLKQSVPDCGLCVLPWTSHTTNSEEPDAFNRAVLDFLAAVEAKV